MEKKKSPEYLRAKRKVEVLKAFYQHLIVYITINSVMILFMANVFSREAVNFSNIGIYTIAFFWGIGLVSHAIYVFFEIHFKINFLRRWEERKIQQFMDDDKF